MGLDEQMKAAGMRTIDEMVASLTNNPLLLTKEVTDLESFEWWLETCYREFISMQAERDLKKQDGDDMYEWILAHASLFGSVLAHYRQATQKQKEAS